MPKKINWAPIEQAWRETRTAAATLAKMHAVSLSSLNNHMTKTGTTRNPHAALKTATDAGNLPVVIPDASAADLELLRKQVIGRHQAGVEGHMRRLELITQRLDANPRLTDMQRLAALKTIEQIFGELVKIERQAHNIVEQAPPAPPPVAIQVNIDLSPYDAYMQLIGKK